jgi:Histone methylation protein DOT1
VSTIIRPVLPENEIDRLHELSEFLHAVGDAHHLLVPEQLTMRLNVLDKLDALIGDLDLRSLHSFCGSELITGAKSIRSQFEAANETLYEAAHAEIALQGNSPALDRWLRELVNEGEAERPHPGLSFDLLDEIVSGILQFRGPGEAGLLPSPEMTAYQPTPARHILDLIAACRFSSDDVFVDLGSGLGHVPLLVCILAGIRTRGIEVQPDHAASARETAECLNLSRVQFVAEDARKTDFSDGTVFYMFTPFTGSILTDVVDRLRRQSKTRQIRICTLGPCTCILQGQPWLTVNQATDTERIAIFRSL